MEAFSYQDIGLWACRSLAPGSLVLSDGLGCFAGVQAAQWVHAPNVVGRAKPRDLPDFRWVNTVRDNLKRTINGAHHSLKCRKYADSYIAGFAYRFNRRFDLHGIVAGLIVDVARTGATPLRQIRAAEEHC